MNHLKEVILSIPNINALVVGDLILDRYIWGTVDRISPEAPIQILDVNQKELQLGGAANVCQNLISLGNSVRVASRVGDDPAGKKLEEKLQHIDVDTKTLRFTPERDTPLKSRMIAHGQQVLRMDQEDTYSLPDRQKQKLIEDVRNSLDWADVVLLADYQKGILPAEVLSEIFSSCREQDLPTLVDPKGRNYNRYRGTYAITPNKQEAEQATDITLNDDESYRRAADRLFEQLACERVIITRGSEGMSLFEQDDLEIHVPAEEIEVFDVTGAGDTVLATLGWVFGAGEPPLLALQLANIAGARTVEHLGTAVISRKDLFTFHEESRPEADKIVDLDQIGTIVEHERKTGKSIVFTNGCFDLLHCGHIQSLEFASNQGNVLVVGVNADRSVEELKGETRPVQNENDRARILASLEMVDYVVIFSGETPIDVIQAVTPDVLVKGEDWKGKDVVGQDIVESHGGRVAFAPLKDGYSTTNLIETIQSDSQ